jgi:hypothetical protein
MTKAAELIQRHFPRCVVVDGIEHVCSLIFEMMFKLHPCSTMKIIGNMVSTAVIILAL